jgi:hypothetical protein
MVSKIALTTIFIGTQKKIKYQKQNKNQTALQLETHTDEEKRRFFLKREKIIILFMQI